MVPMPERKAGDHPGPDRAKALDGFGGGGCAWVADRTPGDGTGPGTLFHPGAIDVAGLVVMTLALAVARQAARQARAGAR